MTRRAFAVATPGFERVVADELRRLGVPNVAEVAGGAEFDADDTTLVRANVELRAASRVVVRIAAFTAKSFAELERRAKKVPWKDFVAKDGSAAFRVTCRKSRLYHSDAVAERLEKSLRSAVAGVRTGRAAKDDEVDGGASPAQLFVVRFDHDECTVSADASGELLHRRGYRLAVAKAPLRETLAAGALLALGYDGSQPLLDPMCGSGTIAIEAAMIARRMPPNLERRFACESWPSFDSRVGDSVRAAARAAIVGRAPAPIYASDRDAGAVEAAIANAARAGVASDVRISQAALSAAPIPPGTGIVLVNPPYGERVGERGPLRNLYAQIGNVARDKLAGWTVALISADKTLDAQAGLPFDEIVKFSNGGIKVRLIKTTVS